MDVLLLLHNRGSILKNVPRDSVYCVAHNLRCPMYCARIRLLSLARPGLSENVTDDTLAWHLLEHLYMPCLLSSCVRLVSSDYLVHRLLTIVTTGIFRSH